MRPKVLGREAPELPWQRGNCWDSIYLVCTILYHFLVCPENSIQIEIFRFILSTFIVPPLQICCRCFWQMSCAEGHSHSCLSVRPFDYSSMLQRAYTQPVGLDVWCVGPFDGLCHLCWVIGWWSFMVWQGPIRPVSKSPPHQSFALQRWLALSFHKFTKENQFRVRPKPGNIYFSLSLVERTEA